MIFYKNVPVLDSDKVLVVDVDGTLIKWCASETESNLKGLEHTDDKGNVFYFVPIESNIRQLKEHKSRGHKVIVWSAAGYQFALLAVKLLQLETYVDLVMCKASWALDDLPPEEYMPKSQWIKDD